MSGGEGEAGEKKRRKNEENGKSPGARLMSRFGIFSWSDDKEPSGRI
jgi:hypothetical protein